MDFEYLYMYVYTYTGTMYFLHIHVHVQCTVYPVVQAGLVVARLWSCSSEQMGADDVNQYLGWTVAQLSRSVGSYYHCTYMYMYVTCTCTCMSKHVQGI